MPVQKSSQSIHCLWLPPRRSRVQHGPLDEIPRGIAGHQGHAEAVGNIGLPLVGVKALVPRAFAVKLRASRGGGMEEAAVLYCGSAGDEC